MSYMHRAIMITHMNEAAEHNQNSIRLAERILSEGKLKPGSKTWHNVNSIKAELQNQSLLLKVTNEPRRLIRGQALNALSLCLRAKGTADTAIYRINPNAHAPIVFTDAEDMLRGIHQILINQELKLLHILDSTGDVK